MNRSSKSISFILILCTLIGVEGFKIYQDITSSKTVNFDDKIEIPEPFEIEETVNTNDKTQINKDVFKDQKNKKETTESKTKPLPENKFLKTSTQASDHFQYSKEEYLSKTKSKKTNSPNLVSNWEKKILNPESVIEKSLSQASKNIRTYESEINTQSNSAINKDMERFAIKIELPEMNEGTKFTLQYREPPDFGRSQVPDIAPSPARAASEPTFSIEKTKAYDSPWNNFSGSKNFP